MNETDIPIEWLNGKGIRGHLAEMAALPNPPNADLKKGFTVTRWLKSTAGQSPWPGVTPWEGKDDLALDLMAGYGCTGRICAVLFKKE